MFARDIVKHLESFFVDYSQITQVVDNMQFWGWSWNLFCCCDEVSKIWFDKWQRAQIPMHSYINFSMLIFHYHSCIMITPHLVVVQSKFKLPNDTNFEIWKLLQVFQVVESKSNIEYSYKGRSHWNNTKEHQLWSTKGHLKMHN